MIRGEDGVGGEMKRAFLFACQTGLRWSDLCALTWGRIRGLQIETTQKKTGEVLYVPLNAAAWALIDPGGHKRGRSKQSPLRRCDRRGVEQAALPRVFLIPFHRRRVVVGVEFHPCQVKPEVVAGDADGA